MSSDTDIEVYRDPDCPQLLMMLRQWDSRMHFTTPDKHKLKSMLDQIPVGNRLSVLKTKGGFYTPLHFASKCGYIDIMSVMLNSLPDNDARLDVLTQTRFDCTPLLSAAVWNKLQSVQALLSHLSPPHRLKLIMLADKCDRTAMDYAIRFKQQDMINLLLEHTMQASLHQGV